RAAERLDQVERHIRCNGDEGGPQRGQIQRNREHDDVVPTPAERGRDGLGLDEHVEIRRGGALRNRLMQDGDLERALRRTLAEATIFAMRSRYATPLAVARIGRSEWLGCRPASGLASMKLGTSWASERRSMRPASRQASTRHAASAEASARATSSSSSGRTQRYSTSDSHCSLLTYE